MVFLRIQITIDKMQLCSLSVAYACSYHNPTMGYSVHNVDNSKPLTHMTPHTRGLPSAQQKTGFIHEEHFQWSVSIRPLKSVTTPNSSQVKTLARTSMQMSFSDGF